MPTPVAFIGRDIRFSRWAGENVLRFRLAGVDGAQFTLSFGVVETAGPEVTRIAHQDAAAAEDDRRVESGRGYDDVVGLGRLAQ